MRGKGFALFVSALVIVAAATVAFAHGGGLDAQGGHRNRKAGGYHFHRGPLAGRSFSDKSAATAALRQREVNAAPVQPSPPREAAGAPEQTLTVDEKLAVLVRLLETKGVLERGEFEAALRQAR